MVVGGDRFNDEGSGSSSEETGSHSDDISGEIEGARESTLRSVVFSDQEPEEIPNSDVDSNGSPGNKIVQRKNRRTSCVTDLATGREGGARGQMAQVSDHFYMVRLTKLNLHSQLKASIL